MKSLLNIAMMSALIGSTYDYGFTTRKLPKKQKEYKSKNANIEYFINEKGKIQKRRLN